LDPKIVWLGHASFRIEHNGRTIFIDPWKLKGTTKADLILIGPSDVKPKLGAINLKPGDAKDLGWVMVEAHRAYNPLKQFHPRTNDWLGYVIDLAGYRIYHCGDTDIIPEMADLRSIDVALIPVGGTYTMDPLEAVKAVAIFKPKLAIPMHWGDIIGDRTSADAFKDNTNIPTRILDIEQ
jgi:L-ascorbate metabolism protein UlaG (beta-lactamase superfamily)